MKLHAPSQQLSSYEEALSLFPSSAPDHHRATAPLSEATALDVRRLQRIAKLSVQPAASHNGHRNYVVDVTKHGRSSLANYHVRVTRAEIRELRAQLLERTEESRTSAHCAVCTTLLDDLTLDHGERSRLRALAGQSAHEAARVQSLVELLLDHTTRAAAGNAAQCVGCEWAVKLVAALLRQPYEPSTGLI